MLVYNRAHSLKECTIVLFVEAGAETPKLREKEKFSVLLVLFGMHTLGLECGKDEKRYSFLSSFPSTHRSPDHKRTLSSPLDHQNQVFLEIPSDQIDPEIRGKTINVKSLQLPLATAECWWTYW